MMVKVVAHSLKVALDHPDDIACLAAAVILFTGYGTYPIRVDALQSCCLLPPISSTGSHSMRCMFIGCSHGASCPGNTLGETLAGDWELKLVHHKRHTAAPVVAWAAGSREAHVLSLLRQQLYSSECPISTEPPISIESGVGAPLLVNPESKLGIHLLPVARDNWASVFSYSTRATCSSLAEEGGLSDIEYLHLVVEDGLLPTTQHEVRHLFASLMDKRLVSQMEPYQHSPSTWNPEQVEHIQLVIRTERQAMATAMDTSLHEWETVYSRGYQFWNKMPSWDKWDYKFKRFHIEDVMKECKEVVQGWWGKKRWRRDHGILLLGDEI